MKISKNKQKIILSLGLIGVTLTPVVSSAMIISNAISDNKIVNYSGVLNGLLNFKDIPLDFAYRNSWINLVETSNTYAAAYDWNYKVTLENLMRSYFNGDESTVNASLTQKKPLTYRSALTDHIYLGLQVFGHNTPVASDLNEVGRYEVSNFTALENAGYTLYINKTDPNDLLKIINENTEKTVAHNDFIYIELKNLNGTDNIFFQTTEKVNTETIKTWAGQSINIKLIAVNNNDAKDILEVYDPNYHRTTFNIGINDHTGNEFLQYKLWDWNQYNSNNEDLQAYIANNLLKLYTEIALNYLNFIDPASESYQIKTQPLEGIDNIFFKNQGGGGGTSPGSQLYYAYKYNSFYDLRIFLLALEKSDIRHLYISYDQNNWIQFETDENGKDTIVVEDDLSTVTNDYSNREKLSFNPWIEFRPQIRNFVNKTWELLLFAMKEMT